MMGLPYDPARLNMATISTEGVEIRADFNFTKSDHDGTLPSERCNQGKKKR